jgi:hypothetical protein
MSVVVVISQHLLNVFVQLANKRGLKKIVVRIRCHGKVFTTPLPSNENRNTIYQAYAYQR